MNTVKIINKVTGQTNSAVYAPNSGGNMRYNVDGVFLSDKKFNATYGIIPNDIEPIWKSHVRNLFDEIIQANDSTWILHKPLAITMQILCELAQYADKTKNEVVIGYCCRFALYTFADPTHPDFNQDLTNYYTSKTCLVS